MFQFGLRNDVPVWQNCRKKKKKHSDLFGFGMGGIGKIYLPSLLAYKKNRAGFIVGILVGVVVLGLLALFEIIFMRQRKRRLNEEAGPDVKLFTFNYAELRAATEGFNWVREDLA
ncbi:hypothetical protein ZIOFF_040336 [Zingiber officinale]|uniref:Uncharacterized protein n=1 Tax=Zingiber officinale TaxID=94328 RepID=A0A8J5G644_ZINOF|nr:hypothetical protein ZIOFF_040336 [Zingiber officinale]